MEYAAKLHSIEFRLLVIFFVYKTQFAWYTGTDGRSYMFRLQNTFLGILVEARGRGGTTSKGSSNIYYLGLFWMYIYVVVSYVCSYVFYLLNHDKSISFGVF